MSFESPKSAATSNTSEEAPRTIKNSSNNEVLKLAQGFRDLVATKHEHSHVFKDLEGDISKEGFVLATENELSNIFYDNSLLCRSESFSKVLDLLLEHRPLEIQATTGEANMCNMASGEGFRTAMLEGFSGKDVDGAVKVVITFRDTHLTSEESIPHDKDLWKLKPNTAKVSLTGSGQIIPEDIAMVSFRFPVHLFPEKLLSEIEHEQLEETGIKFIVRHYIPDNKKTIH